MKCPNVNLQIYKDLVNKYGEIGAMKAYVLHGEEIPTLDEAELLLNPKSIELQREVLPPTKDELDSLKKMFNVQNSTYDIKKGNKRIQGINKWLDANEYNYKAVLSKKPDGTSNIITFIKYSPISHSKGVNLNPITKEVITPILEQLSSKFGLKYRYLTKIRDKAQYDPNTDEVIVNPRLMDLDSPFHEFAHPFIKILKSQNPVLYAKLRFEILKEGKILKQVQKSYSDLSKESQIEESIVTAIGLMSAEEYSKSSLKKTIDKFLQWLYDFIKAAFGKYKAEFISDLDYNTTLRDIAKLIIGDSFNEDLTNIQGEYEKAAQRAEMSFKEMNEIMSAEESSFDRESEDLTNRNLKDIETVVKKAIENLQFKLKHETQRGLGGTSVRKAYITIINELNEANAQESLIKALDEAKISINNFYKQYLKARENGTFNIKSLSVWRTYLLGYSWLEDLHEIIKNNSQDILGDLKDTNLSKTFLETEVVTQIGNILDKRNRIQDAFVKEGLPLLAKVLARHSAYGEAQFKDEQERIYRALPKTTRDKFTFKEYIQAALEYNEDHINETTELKILDELKVASKDINAFLRWMDNILDSPDYVMSAAGSMYSEMLYKTNVQLYAIKDKILDNLKPLEKFLNFGPTKSVDSFYDYMLEKDDKGNKTGHYIWKWRSSMLYDYLEERDKIQNDDKLSKEQKLTTLGKLKNKYAVRNDRDYFDARWEHIEDLHDNGIIPDDDYTNLKYNEGMSSNYGERRAESTWNLVKDGRISQSTGTAIDAWESEYDWLFRTPVEKYMNPQWEELKKLAGSKSDDINEWSDSDPRIKFFKFIVGLGKEADKKVPVKKRLGTRLPGILKTTGEFIKAGETKSIIDNFTYKFSRLWNPDPDELSQNDEIKNDPKKKKDKSTNKEQRLRSAIIDSEGKLHKFVPIQYTTKYDPKDMSYDVATLYMGYYGSATKYANKMEILPEMEMLQYFLRNRDVAQNDRKGKALLKDLIGGAASKIKDARVKKADEDKTLVSAQFSDFLNLVMYEEGMSKTKFEKIMDNLSKYTAFRVLSFNIMNGIGNVLTGETMQKVEAISGQYVNIKDLSYASAYYDRHIVGLMKDIGVGQRQSSNIINLLNEKFRTLNEDVLVQFRKNTGIQHFWDKSKLFFLMHAGEHFMQSRMMLALLNHQKAKDSNGNVLKHVEGILKGKDLSILDAYKVKNGELILDERVDLKRSKWTEDDQAKFGLKLKRILRNMHGAYGEEEKVAIQRYALGRMVYQFKKFMVPNIRRRWAKKYINNQLREYTEGNYITFAKWFKELGREFYIYTLSNLSEERKNKFIENYGNIHSEFKDVWNHLTYSGFTEAEFANIRRTTAEIGVFIGIAMLLMFVIPSLDDDDDDSMLLNKAMYNYIILRLYSEWTMYVNPLEGQKLIQSPAASYAFVQDSLKLVGQLFDPYEVYKRGPFKGDNKLYHRLVDLMPIIRIYNKIIDAKQQSSIFKRYNWFVPKEEKEKK